MDTLLTNHGYSNEHWIYTVWSTQRYPLTNYPWIHQHWTYVVWPTHGHPPDKVSVDSMDTLTYILHTLDIHNITNPWIPLDKVSKVSLDTLPRGYPLVGYTMYVQQWLEYPWNLCILCQRVSMGWQYYVCPTLIRVSMESLPKLTLEVHSISTVQS